MRLEYTKSSSALEAYNYNNILEKGFALIKKMKIANLLQGQKASLRFLTATIYFFDGTIKADIKKKWRVILC